MKIRILFIVIFTLSAVSSALAAEKAGSKATVAQVPKKEVAATDKKAQPSEDTSEAQVAETEGVKDVSGRVLAERIKGMLTREKGVINFVPGLKEMQDADGNIFYTYNGTKLENLGRETLNRIFNRVRNEALRLRMERLQKQLNTVNQGQRLGGAAGQVPMIPQISVASKLPSQPPQPPKIPKTPTLPPIPRR